MTVAVGDVVGLKQTDSLPDGSQVQRVDGPKQPYVPMQKTRGLWVRTDRRRQQPHGIGTADWLVLRVGFGA